LWVVEGLTQLDGALTALGHTMGTGAGVAALVGIAYVNITAVGNVGAGEDDLMTYSLLANSLSAVGKAIRVKAWGTTANNANAKTVAIRFGTQVEGFVMSISIAGRWVLEAIITKTGSNTQDTVTEMREQQSGSGLLNPKTALSISGYTQTDTAAITVKCTGTGTADNDIVQEGMLIEFLN
jgi:hypothetical protein